MNPTNEKRQPGTAGATGDFSPMGGGGLAPMIPSLALTVKGEPRRLLEQAQAAELRALACAAWHRERAGRYLAWCDSPWAAAQYNGHVSEAAYQDALAARHRSIAAALGEVRP